MPGPNQPSYLPEKDQVDFYVRPDMKQSNPYLNTLFWNYGTNTPPPVDLKVPQPKGAKSYIMPGLDLDAPSKPTESRASYFDDLNQRALEASRKQDPNFGSKPLIDIPQEQTERYTGLHGGYYYQRRTDNEERAAENQTLAGVVGTGAINFLEKTGSVAASSIGYLMSLPIAAAGGNVSDASNNWLSKWATETYDNRKNKVFLSKEYQDKSVIGQIFTPQYWATQGADMAGFIAGTLLPSSIVSRVGMLPRLSKGLSSLVWGAKAGRLAEGAEAAGIAAEASELSSPLATALKSRRFLQGMNMTETALTSTISEATFEASDTKQRVYQNLVQKGVNPIEAKKTAQESADRTFWWNTALLLPSNLWEVKAILGTKAGLAKTMEFLKDGKLVAPVLKDKLIKGGQEALIGAVAEGLWEENVQNSIQNLGDKISNGDIDSDLLSQIGSLITDSASKNFTTREGQENIVGGALMGILAGGVSGFREPGSEYKKAEVAHQRYQNSLNSAKDVAQAITTLSSHVAGDDVYLKHPDGTPVLDESGEPILNTPVVVDKIKNLAQQVDLSRFMASAAQANDSDLFTHAKNLFTSSFVYNHMVNGMEEVLDDKMEALVNASPQERQELGAIFEETGPDGIKLDYKTQVENLRQKVNEYKRIFNKVYDFYGRGQEIWDPNLGNYFVNPVGSIYLEAINNLSLKESVNAMQLRKQELEGILSNKQTTALALYNDKALVESPEPIEEVEDIIKRYVRDNKTDLDVKEYTQLSKKLPSYIDQLKDSNERYKLLTNPETSRFFKDLLSNYSAKVSNKEPAEPEQAEVTEAPETSQEPDIAEPGVPGVGEEDVFDDTAVSAPPKKGPKPPTPPSGSGPDESGIVVPDNQKDVLAALQGKKPSATQSPTPQVTPEVTPQVEERATPSGQSAGNLLERFKGTTSLAINPRNTFGQLFSPAARRTYTYKPESKFGPVYRRNVDVPSTVTTDYEENLAKVAYETTTPKGIRARAVQGNNGGKLVEILDGAGNPIGQITSPDTFFYKDSQGNDVTLDYTTSEEDFVGVLGEQSRNEYQAFKALNYAFTTLYKALENNNGEIVDNLLDVTIQNNELQVPFSDSGRSLYSNLSPAINGVLDNEGNRHRVIISVPSLYDERASTYRKYEDVRIIRDANEGPDEELTKKIRKAAEANLDLIQRIGTRYVAMVELPGGTQENPNFKFVALAPVSISTSDLKTLFDEVKAQSSKAASENVQIVEVDGKASKEPVARDFNDDLNDRLINEYYIANRIPLKSIYDRKTRSSNDLSKSDMTLTVSPTGSVRFTMVNRALGTEEGDFVRTVYVSPEEMARINNMTGLVSSINEKLQEAAKSDISLSKVLANTKLEVSSFKKGVVDDVTNIGGQPVSRAAIGDIADKLITPYTSQLIRPIAYITPKDNLINDAPSVSKKEEAVPQTQPLQQESGNKPSEQPAEEVTKTRPVTKPLTNKERMAAAKGAKAKLEEQIKQSKNAGGRPPISDEDFDDLANLGFKLNDTWSKDRIIMNEAEKWLNDRLPISEGRIGFQQINPLIHRVSVGGKKVWGYVESGVVYLNKNAGKGTEYHEAFHAVFRNLLSDSQIDSYLKFGRREIGNPKATDLEVEEYLADKFMDWRLGKEKAGIWGKLWNFLRDAINLIFTHRRKLSALFHSIDRGDYRFASLADNRFTLKEGATPEPAYKLIELPPEELNDEKGTVVPHYLNPDQSREIIQNVVSYAQAYREQNKDDRNLSDDELVDKVIKDLRDLYDIDSNPAYKDDSGNSTVDEDALFNKFYIYADEDNLSAIKEGATSLLSTYRSLVDEYAQSILDDEAEDGPSTKYDDSKENHGGFNSLPKELRAYIGLTSYDVQDEFGNSELRDGVPLRRTIDGVRVYYSILRGMANLTSEDDFLQKLEAYSRDNDQTSRFFQKLLKDIGISLDDLKAGKLENIKNPVFAQKVIKAFNKARVDYLHSEYNLEGLEGKSYKANRRNVEHTQFNLWNNGYIKDFVVREDPEGLKNIKNRLIELEDNVVGQSFKLDEPTLLDHVSRVQNTMSLLGINLSKGFVKYSLLQSRVSAYDNAKSLNPGLTFDSPDNKFITEEDYSWADLMEIPAEQRLDTGFISTLKSIISLGNNPFTEMDTRLLNVAKGNASFDESVGDSSFTSADNKTIYSHQDWTFNLRMIHDLRNPNFRDNLREGIRDHGEPATNAYDKEWLTDNVLLNLEGDNKDIAENFEAIANGLEHNRDNGLRSSDNSGSVTYGDYSPREFALSLLNNYASYVRPIKVSRGKTVLTAPHLIRVLEAKKTADLVNLPVIEGLYAQGQLTDKALGILSEEVRKEFGRIRRVKDQIDSGLTDNVVWNYHIDPKGGTPRGLQISDSLAFLLDPENSELKSRVERVAVEGGDYADLEGDVKASILKQFNKMVDGTIQLLENEGLVRTADGRVYNVLLPSVYFRGSETLGLGKNAKDNIAQVLADDFVNTLAFNQILHGDPALSFKNDGGIDQVKRAGGDNAALTSIYSFLTAPSLGITEPFTHSNVAIIEEPTGLLSLKDKDGNPIKHDVADAQMWTTVKGLRYTMWGLGRLSPQLASVLDKMERGEEVSSKEIFDKSNGLISRHEMTNSLKLTYKDGKRYLKMSVAVLQPTLTSYKDAEGNWKPYPNMETLHNLRTNMEDKGIHFVSPVSASKMMSVDVLRGSNGNYEFSNLKPHKFDNRYFGLQTENPSNKLEVTLGTQLIQLIDTEQDFTDKDGKPVMVYHNGQFITLADLAEKYQSYISQRFLNNYQPASNSIFYTPDDFVKDAKDLKKVGSPNVRLSQFQSMALQTLQKTGSDPQLLEFFSMNEGLPKYNLNMAVTLDKYVQLYLAYFNRGVFSNKVPGYTAALMSSYGMKTIRQAHSVDENGKPTRSSVVQRKAWLKDKPEVSDKTEGLKEGDYYLDNLKYNEPEYDEKGNITGYYSEVMLPAHFRELLKLRPGEEIPDAVAKMFGIRIPSQDKHSFATLKLVDYLPVNMGSNIVVPPEILYISGADFDIDKMFIQRPDFYTRVGQMVKYGTATSWEDKWDEYKRYQLANNKFLRFKLKDIDAGLESLTDDSDAYESKEDFINDLLNTPAKEIKLREGLRDLGLPYDLNSFKKASNNGAKELNNGVLNNLMLDAMSGLQTNDSARPLAETPATQDLIKEVAANDDHKVDGKPLYDYGERFPVDSLPGKFLAHKNNTTGKRNIGIDVNFYMAATILQKYEVPIINDKYHFSFDGHTFDTYAGTRQFNPGVDLKEEDVNNFTGPRTFAITDNLTSAATDEAKDQQNALYNLSIPALRVVNTLVLQHVPLATAIDLVNQPAVQDYIRLTQSTSGRQVIKSMQERELSYTRKSDREEKFRDIVLKNLVDKFNISEGAVKTASSPDFVGHTGMDSQKLIEGLAKAKFGQSDISDTDFLALQLKSLDYFQKASELADYIGKLSSVLTLTSSKGISRSFEIAFQNRDQSLEALGIGAELPEDAPFNVQDILLNKHKLSAAYLQGYNNLRENTKKMFVERSGSFQDIAGSIESAFRPGAFRVKDGYKNFKRDLVSFLNISAYKNLMEWKGFNLSSLNNALLFDNQGSKTIIDYHKEALTKAPDNAFVRFIEASSAEDKLGKKNNNLYYYKNYLNTLKGQTRGNVEGSFVTNLIDAFNALDRDPRTTHLAQAYFDYLIAKDGLMFKNDSYIKFMPNYMFGDMSDAMDMVSNLVQLESIQDVKNFANKYRLLETTGDSGRKSFFTPEESKALRAAIDKAFFSDAQDILFKKVFGQTRRNLTRTFIDLYADDSNNVDKLKSIRFNKAVGGKAGDKTVAINPLQQGKKANQERLKLIKELGIAVNKQGGMVNPPIYFKTYYRTSVDPMSPEADTRTAYYKLASFNGETAVYDLYTPTGDEATTRVPYKIPMTPIANLGTRPSLQELKSSYLEAHPEKDKSNFYGNIDLRGIEQLLPDEDNIYDNIDGLDDYDFDNIDMSNAPDLGFSEGVPEKSTPTIPPSQEGKTEDFLDEGAASSLEDTDNEAPSTTNEEGVDLSQGTLPSDILANLARLNGNKGTCE